MLKKLKGYYDRVGISALAFRCKHYEECKSACEDQSKFTTAREPYIGKFYGKRGLPKLLFLSLDPGDSDGEGNDKRSRESRTIEGMRKGNLLLSIKEMPKQRHWYKTHQFAWLCFDELRKIANLNLDIGNTDSKTFFKTQTDIDKIKHYFAHTNSVKCCVNNLGSKQANRTLFDNCREYIPPELRIVNPQILVTQGKAAQSVIKQAIKEKIFSLKNERDSAKANRMKLDLQIIEIIPNRPALWIHHYHPSNYGAFNRMVYRNYRNYAKAAIRFVSDKYPELFQSK
jgi:hypothetical protein